MAHVRQASRAKEGHLESHYFPTIAEVENACKIVQEKQEDAGEWGRREDHSPQLQDNRGC